MKSMLRAKVERQNKGQRNRFEKRPEEFITNDARINARRTALKQLLAKRTLSKSEDPKGPRS